MGGPGRGWRSPRSRPRQASPKGWLKARPALALPRQGREGVALRQGTPAATPDLGPCRAPSSDLGRGEDRRRSAFCPTSCRSRPCSTSADWTALPPAEPLTGRAPARSRGKKKPCNCLCGHAGTYFGGLLGCSATARPGHPRRRATGGSAREPAGRGSTVTRWVLIEGLADPRRWNRDRASIDPGDSMGGPYD